jgi:hypothetical protein
VKLPRYTNHFIDRTGKARFYLRLPGRKRIPLPGLPWSPEFMEARERAMNQDWVAPDIGASRTVPGTVNAALVSHYQTSAFTSVAKSTQKDRRAILERFRNDHGDKRVGLMHTQALQIIVSGKTPAAQRNFKGDAPVHRPLLDAEHDFRRSAYRHQAGEDEEDRRLSYLDRG